MTAASPGGAPGWWSSLKHGGLLLAPSKLAEFFPEEAPAIPARIAERLRRDLTRLRAGDVEHDGKLLDTVLEDVLEFGRPGWTAGSAVEKRWSQNAITGEVLRPRRLWEGAGGRLPVFVADRSQGTSSSPPRLGVGRGRRDVTRVIEWLRKCGERVALLTNGRQWRLIHAGPDYDAWCEWDSELWFDEGKPSAQVTALRTLLGRAALESADGGTPPPLVAAIQASRSLEAELSAELGERVRRAVEHLVQVSSPVLDAALAGEACRVTSREIYIAACRVVMRCVVILFAEARELLPRSNAIYNDAYSLQGLREQLLRAGGGKAERLRQAYGAWPRLLSLFWLVHDGSDHEALPITRYGGGLFRPGDPAAEDPVLRGLALLESRENTPSDADLLQILDLLSRSRVRVRQGRGSTWVDAPVDFSNLSSEYIGILYEGLLDFELKRAPENDPIVFLAIGDQPALPFSRLDDLSERDTKQLLEKLKKSRKQLAIESDDESGGEEAEEEVAEADEDEDETAEEEDGARVEPEAEKVELVTLPGVDSDKARLSQEMVEIWSRKAVQAAGLVRPPRGRRAADPGAQDTYNAQVAEAARGLVARVVLPGQWYLVRWGGTRKGAGTFYTKPQLAGPTTWRTLQPLAYRPVREEKHEATGLVQVVEWAPRTPEEILALKVCDPAMGSGSFLVAALRYLTQALWESLNHHGRIDRQSGKTICRLADGLELSDGAEEPYPVPFERPDFEGRMKARLKRYVVERSIYGVDIDPLAVELARVSLWVETMARELPMTFLDHKLRCGNSLVGAWLDRFQDYPIQAWERDGGDAKHERFVHHFREHIATRGRARGTLTRKGDVWTQAIKARKGTIQEELRNRVRLESGNDIGITSELFPVEASHQAILEAFEDLHAISPWDPEKQEARYRELVADARYQDLRFALDTWCAVWFWPGDAIELAPGPRDFLRRPSEVSQEVSATIRKLAGEHRFFHWEIEYPDVFRGPQSGFDAVIGNPPWETQKPSSQDFFSNLDPLYRSYGKQEALERQKEYFREREHEEAWLRYCAKHKALSNWTKHVGQPWGELSPLDSGGRQRRTRARDEENAFRTQWRGLLARRRGFADPAHPFLHQGSADINTYKMFLEAAHALSRPVGWFGLIVPSGIYTDRGSTRLRELLLRRCSWEWLFGFENRYKIFDIDSRFKFCPLVVRKASQTTAIRAAFMRHDLTDWSEGDRYVLAYPRDRVERFSPKSKALLEIRSERDLGILETLYRQGVLLGDEGAEGWNIEYATEFHMTNDSKLFPPRPQWEAKGYRSDEYGHWLKGCWKPYSGPRSILERPEGLVLSLASDAAIRIEDIEDVALPLYEGRMIGQLDFSQKGWLSGKGRRAVWRDVPTDSKKIEPQYLMSIQAAMTSRKAYPHPKLAYMRVSSSTNSRTTIATFLRTSPGGDSVFFLRSKQVALQELILVSGLLTSIAYDYQARLRLGGLNLSEFVMIETTLPRRNRVHEVSRTLVAEIASLALNSWLFARELLRLRGQHCKLERLAWALTSHERLRLRSILDAVIAELYCLQLTDLAWILRDCDYPKEGLASKPFTRTLNPKGFWRVDKTQDPELRHTVLSLVAFHELKKLGLDDFLALNRGEGWMLPETLRLADYGLGHDERAREPQPVRSRLGERFLPWQLEQSVEESWEECRRHAELIEKIIGPIPRSVTPAARAGSRPGGRGRRRESPQSPGAPEPLPGSPRQLDFFDPMT
jgi:hypothetical protein